ncbi:MAG: hypothetical protein EOP06_01790 [Proteobacteria bacterium]|nr:MAG: hypothetical protein EOP06_01790 [Pseudomonadota bacterium]
MKTKVLALSLVVMMSPSTFASGPKSVCGRLNVSQTSCDVDFCSIKFMAETVGGPLIEYGVTAHGRLLTHDYDVALNGLDKTNGLEFCAAPDAVTAFGTIDLNDLSLQD